MMNNISRNNHFVPQMYLEAWKNENNKIWTYDLLVPNEKCNLWNEKSSKSIASQQNFYIVLKDKEEADYIEKYLNEKLLYQINGFLRLTPDGILISDQIIADLMLCEG